MTEQCNDNRFEIIKETKEYIIRATNIDTSPEEMEALDSICFRLWQLGLTKRNLDKLIKYEKIMTEQEVLKKFEELGWKVNKKYKENEIYFYRNNITYRLIEHIIIKIQEKLYFVDCNIDVKTHQLLTELFKYYQWIK